MSKDFRTLEFNAPVVPKLFESIISPVDGLVHAKVALSSTTHALEIVENAKIASESWKETPIEERIHFINKFIDAFLENKNEICDELSWLIGRFLTKRDVF